jgi:hypothetical protein
MHELVMGATDGDKRETVQSKSLNYMTAVAEQVSVLQIDRPLSGSDLRGLLAGRGVGGVDGFDRADHRRPEPSNLSGGGRLGLDLPGACAFGQREGKGRALADLARPDRDPSRSSAARACARAGASLSSRRAGAALSTTAKGFPRSRAAAMVSRTESRSKMPGRAGMSTSVATRIASCTTTHVVGAVSMKTHS